MRHADVGGHGANLEFIQVDDREEVDAAIADILAMIEPILIAFLGVTIGSIVIAMYLPLFALIGKLAGGAK